MPDGTLAGSVLTMLEGVRRVAALGIALPAVIRHATGNPAAVIGAAGRGRLAPGARADVLALDPGTLALRGVWVAGVPAG
jgi:N-acetylglucosamine-6-phosphate deacetylase